jgi:hypothetical protein
MPSDFIHTFQHYSVCSNEVKSDVYDKCSNIKLIKVHIVWKPLTKRSQGRPKYRWEDNITQDICQMKIKNWIAYVQDRGKWKEVVEKARTFN